MNGASTWPIRLRSGSERRRWFAVIGAVCLLLAACSSDGGGSTGTDAGGDPDEPTIADESTDDEVPPSDIGDTGETADPADDTAETATMSRGLFQVPPVPGAVLTFEERGSLSSDVEVVITDVSETERGITVSTEDAVVSGSERVDVRRTHLTGTDGSLSLSASGFGASGDGFTVTATGDDVLIPSIDRLEAGDASSGNTFVEFEGDGFSGRNDVTYTVRGEGFDEIETPIGTFTVYVVMIDLAVDSSFGSSQNGVVRSWFVPGFAAVKTMVSIAGVEIVTTLTSSTVMP